MAQILEAVKLPSGRIVNLEIMKVGNVQVIQSLNMLSFIPTEEDNRFIFDLLKKWTNDKT